MTPDAFWVAGACVIASAFLTHVARRLALARDLVDVPNERSSHRAATPRGGGVAVALVTTLGLTALALRGALAGELLTVLVGGGAAVAIVGFVDDHRSLPSWVRLLVHTAAAVWAVAWLGGLPALRFGGYLTHASWLGDVIAVIGIVWVLNLFNFMDGIDGIAGTEAVFIALAGAALTVGATPGIIAICLAFAGACCGFLLWNWPPARIFLGDVGSGYLGYVIAVLALAAARNDAAALWVWLILGGAFFVDATVTLVRRSLRGTAPSQAHRTHAYQWLARTWSSHLRVTLGLLGLNLLWLLPWAVLAARHPNVAAAAVLGALVPLAVLVVIAGAGRAERTPQGA